MTYNQKVIGAITILCVGITSAVTFVCHESPYGENFWISYCAVVVGEAISGGFWIQQIAKSDSAIPVSLGVWGINAVYLLSVFLLTFFTGIPADKYRLVHIVLFALFAVVHLLFRLLEHHVESSASQEDPAQPIQKAKVTWR